LLLQQRSKITLLRNSEHLDFRSQLLSVGLHRTIFLVAAGDGLLQPLLGRLALPKLLLRVSGGLRAKPQVVAERLDLALQVGGGGDLLVFFFAFGSYFWAIASRLLIVRSISMIMCSCLRFS